MARTALHKYNSPAPNAIEVIQLGPTIGAKIGGVDFSHPVKRQTADAIRNALTAHKVLFFRDTKIPRRSTSHSVGCSATRTIDSRRPQD